MHIRRPVCVFALLFVCILTILMLVTGSPGNGRVPDGRYDGRVLSVEGTVKRIETKNDKSLIHLKVISPTDKDKELSDNILIYLTEEETERAQLHIGQRACISGRMNLFKPAYNKGQFDMREYYGLKHYSYVCYDGRVENKYASYSKSGDVLYRIRLRTEKVYERYYDDRYSGIVKALVLGQRGDLDEDIREQYKNAGISHILALSGLHIVTMGFIIFGLLRKTDIPQTAAAIIPVVLIILYCIMTGMPTSAVRALIMFIISMGAVLAGRTNDLRTASAIAAVIMLVMNPSYLYEAGFLLSFSAVIGIGLVYPSVRAVVLYMFDRDKIRRLHRSDRKTVRAVMALLRALLFPLAIQMTIAPLTMWYYYQIPTYGIIVNLLVVPLAGALLAGSLITGIAGNAGLGMQGGTFPVLYMFTDGLCRLSSFVSSGILKLYDLITEGANSLPGGLTITGRPKLWQMAVYYLILLAVVSSGYMLMGKERRLKRETVRRRISSGYDVPESIDAAKNRIVGYLRIRSAVLLCSLIAGAVILFIKIQPECEISLLYAGQGQCIVIHGSRVPSVMYDCGSTDVKELGKYTVIPFLKYSGIDEIDTVFISHLDSDHVSGLIELLGNDSSGISVGRVVIPDTLSQEKSENYIPLIKAAEQRGVPVYRMAAGDKMKWRRLTAACLSPYAEGENGWNAGDINEDSLVLDIRYDEELSALFTGDISTAVEQALLNKVIGKYDWLQVAHHGSKSAADRQFIEAVRPSAAVISAGINNQYGHPHDETLEILREQDIDTFITSRDGEVDCILPSGLFPGYKKLLYERYIRREYKD